MQQIPVVRAILIGLVGLLCTGCLEAGPRGYFENSVFGANPVDLDRDFGGYRQGKATGR